MAVSKKFSDALEKGILAKLGRTLEGEPRVDAGFFSQDQYPDGTSVATVAYWNEKGSKTSPARPFMRNAISNSSSHWTKTLKGALKYTNGDVSRALEILGSEIQSDIQESIKSGNYKPNSALTNLLKDRFPSGDYTTEDFLKAVKDLENGETGVEGKPLIWSGKLFQSVRYQVEHGV